MKNRIFKVIFIIILLLVIVNIAYFLIKNEFFSTEKYGNVSWSYNETTKTLTVSGKGNIDKNINYYGMEKIIINEGITSIDNGTFKGCKNITDIIIPNSVTSIGEYAFCDCTSLKSITIPNSVTNIGNYAFSGCTSLKSITIPNSVSNIGEYAFDDCTSLKSNEIWEEYTENFEKNNNKVTNATYQAKNEIMEFIDYNNLPLKVEELEWKVPYINIDSKDAEIANKEIKSKFEEYSAKFGKNQTTVWMEYGAYEKNGILSVIIYINYGSGTDGFEYISKIYTYNFNVITGKFATFEEVCKVNNNNVNILECLPDDTEKSVYAIGANGKLVFARHIVKILEATVDWMEMKYEINY